MAIGATGESGARSVSIVWNIAQIEIWCWYSFKLHTGCYSKWESQNIFPEQKRLSIRFVWHWKRWRHLPANLENEQKLFEENRWSSWTAWLSWQLGSTWAVQNKMQCWFAGHCIFCSGYSKRHPCSTIVMRSIMTSGSPKVILVCFLN